MSMMEKYLVCGSLSSMSELHYGSASVLLGMARRLYGKVADKDDHITVLENSVSSILLSCAATEAFINETSSLMAEKPGITAGFPKAKAFAEILSEAEAARTSIRLKYQLALVTLIGRTFDKGSQPYQDFDLLFKIRDELMHYKLEKTSETPHRLVQAMRARKLGREDSKGTWMQQVATPKAAWWACNTAVEMINTIQNALADAAEGSSPASPIRVLIAMRFNKLPEWPPKK